MRVCQFRHFGKSDWAANPRGLPVKEELRVIFYRGTADCQTTSGLATTMQPEESNRDIRKLAHDLSNSLETIVQAAYLLGQAKLDENGKKWTRLIDNAAKDAVRLNRQIREILKSQS
jgi:nitrogen-specific signal transduction histidine kinase